MGLSTQAVEELLSVSYVVAVSASAGAPCEVVKNDYGVDIAVRRIDKFNGQVVDLGVAFDCQLKASVNYTIADGYVVYDMEVPAYNKLVLRSENSSTPIILVLLCLPKERSNWLNLTADELVLRKCCYWTRDFVSLSPNSRTVRIRIPVSQMFTPDCVSFLISEAAGRRLYQ